MNDRTALDPANAVTLTVNGHDYGGWLDVSITAGVERQAREFTVAITRGYPDAPQQLRAIAEGDSVVVRIGPDKVLSGYVFVTPRSHDGQNITFGIAGRSRTADIVDCGALNQPGHWKGQTVLSIVRALVEPYGVPVVSEVGAGPVISDHAIEPGETVFSSIDKLLKLSRLLSTDDAEGRLVLVAPGGGGRASDALVLGQNILSANGQFDFSGVFSEYVVKGQSRGKDGHSGAAASEVNAAAKDDRTARKRVMVMHESGNLSRQLAQERADYERGSRMAKALAVSVEVAGWRQSNGQLWRHNQIVRFRDDVLGLDRDMMIGEITYKLSGSGTIAALSIAPPDAYMPEPADPKGLKGKKRKKKGSKDEFEYLLDADWEKKA
ncbi:baseplate protein [Chromobacterium haemolyticum]|uniref:Baseplate protein n=1 Tax=Chromobacterium fluminis TaxID=3044269 RepID=A0ABX0LAC9_9NEIS|nr:baseplate protein [Chromobacterium haemolyticum]NHR08003.1 baseplate protein [Chromobacterium haemolyticum]